MKMRIWTAAAIALLVGGTAIPNPLAAQTSPGEEAVEIDETEDDHPEGPSPGGAFLRSLIVPGWGQAAYDANLRGGVFFAAQTGGWFMTIKSAARLSEARDIEHQRIQRADAQLRDSLLAEAEENEELAKRYEEDPLALERDVNAGIEADRDVEDIRELVSSRRQQREDWITVTLFMTLASGVDALVNAHLADSPARVVAEPNEGGGFSIGLRVPLPRAR